MTEKLVRPTAEDHVMWDIWSSMYFMPTLTAADELGLFAALEDGPLTLEEICSGLRLETRAVKSVMGLLVSLKFCQLLNGYYCLTNISRNYLLPSSPFYWGGFFRLVRDFPVTYEGVLASIKENKPQCHSVDIYELSEDDEWANAFTGGMHSVTLSAALAAVDVCDFSGINRLLDVGGGSGNFCIALAQQYRIPSTVLELKSVCKVVDRFAMKFGVESIVNSEVCDFFKDEWPCNHNAVFFGNIFHNWSLKQCRFLAQKAYDYLPQGGRIILQEMLLDDDGHGPKTVSANSMVMLFNNEGQQFMSSELVCLLKDVGFSNVSINSTQGYYSIMTAHK